MKKLILFISAGIIFSSGLTSCNKSYTCECVSIQNERSTSTIIATNRTEGQKKCDENGLLGHCELK